MQLQQQHEAEPVSYVAPKFPVRSSDNWPLVCDAVKEYQRLHHLSFRARDSILTATYNEKLTEYVLGGLEQSR